MYFGCGEETGFVASVAEEMVFVARACLIIGLQCYRNCHKYLIRHITLNKKNDSNKYYNEIPFLDITNKSMHYDKISNPALIAIFQYC